MNIVWEKWIDPFMAAVEEHREKGWCDSYEYADRPGQMGVYAGPALVGSAGIVPLNELNAPGRNFNLWVGHCDFVIGPRVTCTVVQVPGVEIFKVWTPYRFWLGVGKAFSENEVKMNILSSLRQLVLPKKKKNSSCIFDSVCENASRQYLFWAVFLTDTGKIEVFGHDCREAVEGEIARREGHFKRIVTSWQA